MWNQYLQNYYCGMKSCNCLPKYTFKIALFSILEHSALLNMIYAFAYYGFANCKCVEPRVLLRNSHQTKWDMYLPSSYAATSSYKILHSKFGWQARKEALKCYKKNLICNTCFKSVKQKCYHLIPRGHMPLCLVCFVGKSVLIWQRSKI